MAKRGRTWAVSLACGAVCALCVVAYAQSVRGEAEAARTEALSRFGGEQLEVCVAKRDIAAGETIEANAIETTLWIADLLPEQAVRSFDEVKGKQVSSTILAGEVLTLKRFGSREDDLEVPAGFVALSVPTKVVQAVGGAVCSGCRVDVYASGSSTTSLIVEDALVLDTSVNGDAGKASADLSWVTLSLDPTSVQETIAAAQKTELYLSLPGAKKQD